MYVAVKGGETAIEHSLELLADRRRGARDVTEVSLKPTELRRRDGERARTLTNQAHEILLRGTTKHLMSAVSLLRRAIDADAYCALAFAGLAEALVRKYLYWDGDPTFLDEAREHARRALALDPDCAEAHTSLGLAYHLSGHPADAQREYRLAIQLDQDEWLAHRLLGSLLAREGNFKNAAPHLKRAINLRPHHIGSYDHLYKVLRRLGRHEEADESADEGVAAARAHLKEVPDNQEARLHMALLEARQGAGGKAREIADRALEIAPKDGFTCFHAGLVHAILGDHSLAVENIRKARDRGFHVRSELVNNPDLDSLRGLVEFQELLKHSRRIAAKGLGDQFAEERLENLLTRDCMPVHMGQALALAAADQALAVHVLHDGQDRGVGAGFSVLKALQDLTGRARPLFPEDAQDL